MSAGARCTVWASHTSSPSQPSRSRYSTGRAAVPLAAVLLLVERLGEVCVQAYAQVERASVADSRSRSVVTENGEQGASATRTIAPGAGSWNRSTASWRGGEDLVDALDHRVGRQPAPDRPRSIEPRVGWKRSPIRPAASTVAASRSPPPCGKT